MIVVLDSGVLGKLCAPEVDRQLDVWMTGLLHRGRRVVVPEVCDYELRREMLRARSKTLVLLDELEESLDYLPITTRAMRRASELWAWWWRRRMSPTCRVVAARIWQDVA